MGISAKQVKKLRDKTGAGMLDCKNALKETEGDIDEAVAYLEKQGIAAAKKKSGRTATEGVVETWISEDKTEGILLEINCETDFVARNEQFREFTGNVVDAVGEAGVDSVEQAEQLEIDAADGETIEQYTVETISEVGENVNLRRMAKLSAPEGVVGAYVHAGEQIGVLVQVDIADELDTDEVESFARDVAMHIAAMNPEHLSPEDIPEQQREEQKEIFSSQMEQEGKPEHIIPRIVEGKMKKWESQVAALEQPFVKDTDKTVGEYQDEIGDIQVTDFVRFEVGEGLEEDEKRFDEEVAEQLES